MTEPDSVTVTDTIRWLHSEGLVRLAGVSGPGGSLIAAFTVDVATGSITVYPVTGVGTGSDVTTLAADDLPFPAGSAKRLVIVGVTPANAVVVLDLASVLGISINADHPETAARSWALQLLLNPEITLTTNSAAVAIAASPRCRRSFMPGSTATIVNVDDQQPPITTITLNAETEEPDRLEILPDDTGELYLGARFWELSQVLTVDDDAWAALAERLEASETPSGPGVSSQSGALPPAGAAAVPGIAAPMGGAAPPVRSGR